MSLHTLELFIMDLDGTIYLGNRLIDGAINLVNEIQKLGKKYVFLTNNSSTGVNQYVQKLCNLGFTNIKKENIVSSSQVTIEYFVKKVPTANIFLLGTDELKTEFLEAGLNITEKKPVDYVVVGFDKTLTFEKLVSACMFINDGASFYATHADLRCPIGSGRYIPDCGSICQLISNTTGVKPTYFGKPEIETVEYIQNRFKFDKSKIAMIGDRWYTDILMANKSGITGILVLSGETKEEDLNRCTVKPDYIFRSVADIYDELKKLSIRKNIH